MSLQSLDSLKMELRDIMEAIDSLSSQISTETDEKTKADLQTDLRTTVASKTQLKDKIFDIMLMECQVPADEDEKEEDRTDNHSNPADKRLLTDTPFTSQDPAYLQPPPLRSSNILKVKQPKEYKSGDDFSTFSYRLRIFIEGNKTSRNDYINVLLSCVDDITLQKLMPIIASLSYSEKLNLNFLLDKSKETLYPQSEVRVMRQQLTSARVVQEEGENVETFAARIRSLVNRAGYSTEDDKAEASLNAFLNGVKGDIADKLFAAPEVESSFDVAVSTAKKLENMRNARSPAVNPEVELGHVLRLSRDNPQQTEQAESQPVRTQRSGEQEQVLNQASNYGQAQRNDNRYSQSQRGRGSGRPYQRSSGDNRTPRTETRRCYRCNIQGHLARNCTALPPLNL